MNKKVLILLITDIVMISAFGFIIYQDNLEMERLKSLSETYAKENESLKIDIEMLRKKMTALENSRKSSETSDFAKQQHLQFKAMKDEIQRLKSENRPDNRERENQVWNSALEDIKVFVDIELTKRLASFGFKPEEVKSCVTEYKEVLERSKDLLLQWYRNDISDAEYEDRILDISREFYKDLSESVGENKASITISVVLPDPNFRKRMFEEK